MQNTIQRWLIIMLGLISSIVIIGGITRLTNSGLSMVDWQPIAGILPPITQAQWQDAFQAYQNSPEYLHFNQNMSLNSFKFIFFWEYIHRIFGRIIGLVALVPFLIFWLKRKLSTSFSLYWLVVVLLIGCQGFMGWYMVKSGLAEQPTISHFRLAAHLCLAFLIFSLILWRYLYEQFNTKVPKLKLNFSSAFLILLSLQIMYGAFTAGLDAGHFYPTYPKMGTEWLPKAAFMLDGFFKNLLSNPIMVQWVHRWLGILVLSTAIVQYLIYRKSTCPTLKKLSILLLLLICLQVVLGIVTLLTQVWIVAAVIHQLMGLIVLGTAVSHYYFSLPPKKSLKSV